MFKFFAIQSIATRQRHNESYILELKGGFEIENMVFPISFFDIQTKCENLGVFYDFPWAMIEN